MRPRDLLRSAARGVRLRSVRSWLTAASFAAGTAAAIALFAITGGAREELLRELRALGADLLAVRTVGKAGANDPAALTFADAVAVRESFPFVREMAPVRQVAASVLLPDERISVEVIGTTSDYFSLRRLRFTRGRPFSREEADAGAAVCVVGEGTERRLAAFGEVYGALVKVGASWCRVIGTLGTEASTGAGLGSVGGQGGRELYLPITTTLRRDLSDRQEVREILLRVAGGVEPESAAPVIQRALARRHDGQHPFEILTARDLLEQQRRARGLLDALLAAVAVLALGLGGVGLAALSWQAVAARTREIAIRRAIGASRGEVLAQFVAEGLLLAAGGGLAGALAGGVGSAVVARLEGWPWTLAPGHVAIVCAVSIGVGLAATIVPARRAALLDPVVALRLDA